ncbi:MAG: hypothetical protein WED09_02820 [Homoserinimonas sp.]
MRAEDESSSSQIANVRVGLDRNSNEWSIFVRWIPVEPPPGAENARLSFLLDDNGNLFLMAVLQGLSCVTAWDEDLALVRQKADPGVSDEVAFWCRSVHMRVTMAYGSLGKLAQDDHANHRILAAASGRRLGGPSECLEANLRMIRRWCEKAGVTHLWALDEVADGSADFNHEVVRLAYEDEELGLAWDAEDLQRSIGRLIGYPVELSFRDPELDPKRARELLGQDRN